MPAAWSISILLFSLERPAGRLLRLQVDLHRQVERGQEVAEDDAGAFGSPVGANAVAETELADIHVEQELLFGIGGPGRPDRRGRPSGNGAGQGQRRVREGAALSSG